MGSQPDSPPRGSAVERECGGKTGSQLHDMEGICNARSSPASSDAGWEGVDGNVFQRAAQFTGPSHGVTSTAPLGGGITVEAEGTAAGKETSLDNTPVTRRPTHQLKPGETQQLGSGNSLPSKMSSCPDQPDDPPLLLMNGSATESEVAKCQSLSSTPLILRKRVRDGGYDMAGGTPQGGRDEPPHKVPRCCPEDNSPLAPEPIGKCTCMHVGSLASSTVPNKHWGH